MPIFDQGYQHWSGHTSGHAWRWLAITRRGVRTALQGRIVRLALLLAFFPAILLVVVLCIWGLVERQSAAIDAIKPLLMALLGQPILAGPRDYRVEVWTLSFHYFLFWELWVDPEGENTLRQWLGSIRPTAYQEPPMCAELDP